MEIINHKLINCNYILTPNRNSNPEFQNNELPDSIIIHYTAMNSFDDAVKVLTRKGSMASAHLVIGKQGDICQLAPFNHRTWHAGVSSYNGKQNYNNYSIGIEIDNLGWLLKLSGKYEGFYSRNELFKKNIFVNEKDVVKANHWNNNIKYEYWQVYKKEQVEVVLEICKALKENYPIKEILGHDEIAVNRKQDPGPAFPMEWLRKEVFKAE